MPYAVTVRRVAWRMLDRPLDEALDWLQHNAVTAAGVDWSALRRRARREASAGVHEAIRSVLAALGERHGRLLEPRSATPFRTGYAAGLVRGIGLVAVHPEHVVVQVASGGPAARSGVRVGDVVVDVDGKPAAAAGGRLVLDAVPQTGVSLRLRQAHRDGILEVPLRPAEYSLSQQPTARRPRADVGYLDLPQVVPASARSYLAAAHHAIQAVDSPALRGWVVDLRRNAGGDLYTMLAAAGPILGDGELGGVVDANGQRQRWAYRDGGAFLRGSRRAGLSEPVRLAQAMPPVAVLTSRLTASAGEGLAVAFRGRPRSRSFGEPTAGVPTGLAATTLGDGSLLSVSACLFVDRAGQAYRDAIAPDEPVAARWELLDTDDDPVLRAAVRWLHAGPDR
jgi:carboxyl-terminal processing protease